MNMNGLNNEIESISFFSYVPFPSFDFLVFFSSFLSSFLVLVLMFFSYVRGGRQGGREGGTA